mmetsp:Transcript_31869/g.55976  ORF Transcript_31869/g.55976 Transcript_31869/m.55976 type:complete len:215 (+) Transcript_31869:682-1326(+)
MFRPGGQQAYELLFCLAVRALWHSTMIIFIRVLAAIGKRSRIQARNLRRSPPRGRRGSLPLCCYALRAPMLVLILPDIDNMIRSQTDLRLALRPRRRRWSARRRSPLLPQRNGERETDVAVLSHVLLRVETDPLTWARRGRCGLEASGIPKTASVSYLGLLESSRGSSRWRKHPKPVARGGLERTLGTVKLSVLSNRPDKDCLAEPSERLGGGG